MGENLKKILERQKLSAEVRANLEAVQKRKDEAAAKLALIASTRAVIESDEGLAAPARQVKVNLYDRFVQSGGLPENFEREWPGILQAKTVLVEKDRPRRPMVSL